MASIFSNHNNHPCIQPNSLKYTLRKQFCLNNKSTDVTCKGKMFSIKSYSFVQILYKRMLHFNSFLKWDLTHFINYIYSYPQCTTAPYGNTMKIEM